MRRIGSLLLREPLAHFLLGGAVLFALHGVFGATDAGGRAIVIGRQDIESLQQQFAALWKRPPTRAELEGLTEAQIREEVLYREGMALGLDRDDTILRRRIAQKMEFLIADTAVPDDPGDTVLRTYFDANRARYGEPPRVSFTHIYFSLDARGARAQADAERVLRALQDPGAPARAPGRGDRFALSYDYAVRTADQVDQEFGSGFGRQTLDLPPGLWRGPVRSAYGLHLVRVTERTPARPAVFEEARDRVVTDFVFEHRRDANEAAYHKLRDRYTITIAPLDAVSSKGSR
jgi:peptidyl-prolyl cis-trans isomerase C